jgi:hypothetical protein
MSKAYLYADNHSKDICEHMGEVMVQQVEHWAAVATISNPYALLVSNLFY